MILDTCAEIHNIWTVSGVNRWEHQSYINGKQNEWQLHYGTMHIRNVDNYPVLGDATGVSIA